VWNLVRGEREWGEGGGNLRGKGAGSIREGRKKTAREIGDIEKITEHFIMFCN